MYRNIATRIVVAAILGLTAATTSGCAPVTTTCGTYGTFC